MMPDDDGNLVARKGRYYFRDGATDFAQRSGLGGHWFEGHPFQTGPTSTAETPKPTWVNGATPTGAGWEHLPFSCNCPVVATKAIFRVDLHLVVPSVPLDHVYPAVTFLINPPTGLATLPPAPWPVLELNIQWGSAPCVFTHRTDGTFGFQPANLVFEVPAPGPGYLFTMQADPTAIRFPVGAGPPVPCSAQWRFYRQVP